MLGKLGGTTVQSSQNELNGCFFILQEDYSNETHAKWD